jgi:hypothetical protein
MAIICQNIRRHKAGRHDINFVWITVRGRFKCRAVASVSTAIIGQ